MKFLGWFRWPVRQQTPQLPQPKTFLYKYLHNPFGNWQFFSVTAIDQGSANVAAVSVFTEMFKNGGTVMTKFYPA